jgi:hypothetical protein
MYKQCSGDGAHYDSVIAPAHEEREFRHNAEWEKRVQLAREEAAYGEPQSVQRKLVNNYGKAARLGRLIEPTIHTNLKFLERGTGLIWLDIHNTWSHGH